MQLACRTCQRPFEAKRAAAKYCGELCKKRAQRRPGGVAAVPPAAPTAATSAGLLESATVAKLQAVGRADCELGAAATLLARRLDSSATETGAGVAALMKEYRATLAEAVKDADVGDNTLDKIRESAALKLISRGA